MTDGSMIGKGGETISGSVKIEHYGYLDGLRGVAAMLVLFVHLPQLIVFAPGDYFGSYGVQLFYILSALTLFLSSEKRFSNENRPVAKFFIRRFFRIAPLFYIVLTTVLLSGFNVFYRLPENGVTAGNVLSHYLFFFGFNKHWISSLIGVEWSIFCEVVFYLTLPLIFFRIKNGRSAFFLLVGSFLVYLSFKSLFFFLSQDRLLYEWSSVFILSNYFYFIIGVFAFFLIRWAKARFLVPNWALTIDRLGVVLFRRFGHLGFEIEAF